MSFYIILVLDLGVCIFHTMWTLVCIHFDSQDAIGRAWSITYNRKSRHIRHRHDTVRKLLSREKVKRSSKGMNLLLRTSHHGSQELDSKRKTKF